MPQKYTEARKQANRRWNEANKDRYARFNVVAPAEMREPIKQAAEASGMSVNAWIIEAIRDKL